MDINRQFGDQIEDILMESIRRAIDENYNDSGVNEGTPKHMIRDNDPNTIVDGVVQSSGIVMRNPREERTGLDVNDWAPKLILTPNKHHNPITAPIPTIVSVREPRALRSPPRRGNEYNYSNNKRKERERYSSDEYEDMALKWIKISTESEVMEVGVGANITSDTFAHLSTEIIDEDNGHKTYN